jgi:hypothetical protein
MDPPLAELAQVARTFPAIDNHAHPLLQEEHRDQFAFEGLISEANGEALIEDAPSTLACFRATAQLGRLFQLKGEPSWDEVKSAHRDIPYDQLCMASMKPSNIQCILFDDGLGGVSEFAESYRWHDKWTSNPNKRIVRVEVLAEVANPITAFWYHPIYSYRHW